MTNPRKDKEELPEALRGRLVAGDPKMIEALKGMRSAPRKPKREKYGWESVTPKEFVEGLGGVWPN
jgi:hypothetical protein